VTRKPNIEINDRYSALGIPRPDPVTVCRGPCEGTGFVPMTKASAPPAYRAAWDAAEVAAPSDDGWHFLKCQTCNGTGRRAGEGSVWPGDQTVNARSGYFWNGNVADPPAGLVTDGHTMIVLEQCNPYLAGVLLEWAEDEEDDDGTIIEARRVPIDACWKIWDQNLTMDRVPARFAETRETLGGGLLRIQRADDRDAWMRPHIAVLLMAAVRFDGITQSRDNRPIDDKRLPVGLGPIVFWSNAKAVAMAMPVRPPYDHDLNMKLERLELDRSPRPDMPAPTSPEGTDR